MNKINKIIIISLLFIITSLDITNADEIKINAWIENNSHTITIVNSEDLKEIEEIKKEEKIIQNKDIFIYFSNFFEVPNSYKYIKLNYKYIPEWSEIEKAIKKLVYLNKIDNSSKSLYINKEVNAYVFYTLAKEILKIEVNIDKNSLINRSVNLNDLEIIKNIFDYKVSYEKNTSSENIFWDKKYIFDDVYNTLTTEHYNHENLNNDNIIYWAIEWLAKWTEDKHTVFFPPVESKSFEDSLAWEYEWIWSYVEMTTPWEVKITSPIPWGPAEKAWLKWWDIIIKVNDLEVKREHSLVEVVSWIKWPAWSIVNITINRNWEEIKLDVKREKIIIKNLETKKVNQNTYHIQIRSFWIWVANEFKSSLEEIKKDIYVNKIIIDLRNNWWGYLNEATDILSLVIPEWEKTAVVKYNWANNNFYSAWLNLIDLNKYSVLILQNSWTASASEIMIGTLKDYFPKIKTIWENTYWKWSVQAIKEFNDWSSLKYTVAKWFTWKTLTWIDWVWFKPDIELELNIEEYKKDWSDNQLNKAINY